MKKLITMKNIILIILLSCPSFLFAQRWSTTELSIKVRELQASDRVIQTNLDNLNAGITKVLSLMKEQDESIKILRDSISKLRTLYIDTSFSFRMRGDTLTLKIRQ